MKKKLQKSDLNLSQTKEEVQIQLLEYPDTRFLDARVQRHDNTMINIEYMEKGLKRFSSFKSAGEVTKYRLGISLIRLTEEIDGYFETYIDSENLYVTSDLKIKMVKRIVRQKNETPEEMIRKIKALIGSLFLNIAYKEILATDNDYLKKDKQLKRLIDKKTSEELEKELDLLIDEVTKKQNQDYDLVKKKTVKGRKITLRFLVGSTVLLLFFSLFVGLFYIPNLNHQLSAYNYYQKQIYEDVKKELDSVPIILMNGTTKYIMTESTIKLSPLSDIQKDNILFNISPDIDRGILDFWVYVGQGNYQEAYKQSSKNNDAQQKAYILMLLIDEAQNNSDLSDADREEKVSTYQGELDGINQQMSAETKEEK
ncbi:MAG: type VII secretion protein EssB/YukC [Mycoplasmatales bacterium]